MLILVLQKHQRQKPALYRSKVLALALAPPNKGDKSIMTKKQCLKPWAVARQLPSLKWVIIGRYRSRSDADGHLQLCRRRVRNIEFKVVFESLDCQE
jgi:hypothetical protein